MYATTHRIGEDGSQFLLASFGARYIHRTLGLDQKSQSRLQVKGHFLVDQQKTLSAKDWTGCKLFLECHVRRMHTLHVTLEFVLDLGQIVNSEMEFQSQRYMAFPSLH